MYPPNDPSPASVVARALTDIATIGSQQYRDESLRISGARNTAELAVILEQSLSRFLRRREDKPRSSGNTINHSYHSCSYTSREARNPERSAGQGSQVIPGDFSSAEEDTCGDFSSNSDEDFHSTPGDSFSEMSDFSTPEPDSFSSTLDSSTSGVHLHTDFSDDDHFSGGETCPPPLLRRFSSSLKLRNQQSAAASEQISGLGLMERVGDEFSDSVDEFSN